MSQRTFSKKGVYHSELVRQAEHGLIVKFTNEPIKSKFGGKGSGYFVPFQVYQDPGPESGDEYTYTIENGDIHSYLDSAPTDTWVKLYAAGSRDGATISLEDEHGDEVVDHPSPASAPTASQDEWPTDEDEGGGRQPAQNHPGRPDWPQERPEPSDRGEVLEKAAEEAVTVFRAIFPVVWIECTKSFDPDEGQEFPSAAVVEAARGLTSTILINVSKG